MAHYAKVEDGVVTQVIVADSKEWCQANLGGEWIQTSYNTHGGVNSRQGGEALHKNYAGIGYTWDGSGFAAPQPFPSWSKNLDTYLWEAPTPMPVEEGKFYSWDEATTSWVESPAL
jgi:hypothetical protein